MTVSETENYLFSQYKCKGFLSQDEITDCCIENNLDFSETDAVMQFLIDKKVLFFEKDDKKTAQNDSDDEIYDKAKIDYEELYDKIGAEYPKFKFIIQQIKKINPPQNREWKNLIAEAQSGNKIAFDRMTKMYLRSVLRISYDFSKRFFCEFEDVFQNGVIGLIKSIKSFNVSSPDSFVSYFSIGVLGELRRAYKINNSFFDLPSHFSEKLFEVLQPLSKYLSQGKSIEESLNLISDDYILRIPKTIKMYILPYFDIEEFDSSYDAHNLEKIAYEDLKKIIAQILMELPFKEREVIKMRFGLGNIHPLTLEGCGKLFKVTRERIRQIENKVLKKLRNSEEKYILKDFADLQNLLP